MTKCDCCPQKVDKPISIVIKHPGGHEVRALVCAECAYEITRFIKNMVDAT